MSLHEFLHQLPKRVQACSDSGPCSADSSPAHYPLARHIRIWLEESAITNVTLYAEGLRSDGILPVPTKYRGHFCGSVNWPDIALEESYFAAAIEVDRARGLGGASLRNALTKGSFNVLTGRFDRCDVFLFLEGKCHLQKDAEGEMVLATYEKLFRTFVHIVDQRVETASSSFIATSHSKEEPG